MNKKYLQCIHEIILMGHWITDQVSIELKELGVTEPQYNVLRILKGAGSKPLTVQDILAKMVQRSSNITRIVDKLISKGFVDRKECPTNRRKMDITITRSGLDMLERLDQKVYAFHQAYEKKLSGEELDKLKNLLEKLKS